MNRFVILCLSAALTATPAWAERPPPPSAAAQKYANKAFTPYDEAAKQNDWKKAAGIAFAITQSPKAKAHHHEAWARLGDALSNSGQKYPALLAYVEAVTRNPHGFDTRMSQILSLAKEFGEEGILGAALSSHPDFDAPKADSPELAYFAARYLIEIDEFNRAQLFLKRVDPKSAYYPKTEALRGIALTQQGKPAEALAPFHMALATSDRLDDIFEPAEADRLRNTLSLNLARTYYAVGNFARAIQYYAEVDRGSEYWPEASFERAWSHFRLKDMTGTLGLLHDQEGPFLEDWYFPEGQLLKTYSLFLLCKFPTARVTIDAFTEKYGPIHQGLKDALADLDAEKSFAMVDEFIDGKEPPVPATMLRPFVLEDRYLHALSTVERADRAMTQVSASSEPHAIWAVQTIAKRRAAIVSTEGQRIFDRLTFRQNELKEMLENVQLTKLDILQFETELYERASNSGNLEFGDQIGELRKKKKRPNTQSWPYQGEYWADEAGYYQYEVRADCREDR